ncbi:uncharacterized protein LOC126844034 [Adelges cooleyi]|uniref:uncharacterized protein LOC126844034 n=1 Tax=Adelges cooleyi TaxID=133065 RepID=UPI00217F44B3|nr:uncharacterized protein LOC126842402 isoform X2 [Adelges cooleyi]XP_050437838.1 uncharacterized protein LOC126844034 [Adelges cooleyi]
MKLLCILTTIAFVNVSPIMTGEYANLVYTTNKYIREAFDNDPAGLETAISNIINEDKPFETLNLMLVIPEKVNIFRINHDERFIMNLPMHIAIADQVAVREAISQVTDIPVPQLGPNENFENDSLVQLGEARRRILGKVTKKLLTDAIGRGRPSYPNLKEVCLLIGLLRSMQFPDSYIKTASVDQAGNVCTLTSQNRNFQYTPYLGYIFPVMTVDNYRRVTSVLIEAMNWFI